MLSEKMQKALNDQLNAELYSAYIYLAMAAYFEDAGLKGMAKWMRVQAQEEVGHAMRFYDHIVERNGRVSLQKIDQPPFEWKSPLEAFEAAYAHECSISKKIHDIVDMANTEKDHPTRVFLNWFVDEQVEEEAQTLEIVGQLKLAGDSKGALLMLDRQLGAREKE